MSLFPPAEEGPGVLGEDLLSFLTCFCVQPLFSHLAEHLEEGLVAFSLTFVRFSHPTY